VKRECVLYKASTIYPRYVCFDSAIAAELIGYLGDPKKRKKLDCIAAKFLEKKKSEKIDKSIDQMIKPIEKYEYELKGIAGQDTGAPDEQN